MKVKSMIGGILTSGVCRPIKERKWVLTMFILGVVIGIRIGTRTKQTVTHKIELVPEE